MSTTTTTTPRLDEAAVRARLEGLRDHADDPNVCVYAIDLMEHVDWWSRDALMAALMTTLDGRGNAPRSPYPAVRRIAAGILYDLARGKLDEGSATR